MPFVIAFAVSAVLHAAAIAMPGWDLPGLTEPESPPIEAHLAASPRPVPAAPQQQKAKPPRTQAPKKALPTSAPVAMAAGEPGVSAVAPADAAPQPEAVAEMPLPPVAAPAPPWPRTGRVRYVVTYGDGGFVIGETIHEWRIDGEHYSIRSVAEPKGLAALRGRTRSQASEGEVTAEGLRPSGFRDQREGREPESAAFDWPAARAVFSGGRGEGRLVAGTQDLVSVFYQLAWLAPRRNVDISVATASRVGRWTFEWVGEESLTIAGGDLSTLHLRTRSDGDATEVWLAPAHGGLPVKIRYTDRKGDVFEQVADLLELNR